MSTQGMPEDMVSLVILSDSSWLDKMYAFHMSVLHLNTLMVTDTRRHSQAELATVEKC